VKKSEILEGFWNGDLVLVVEYRGSKAEWGTKREEGGKVVKFPILSHRVEAGGTAFPIREDLRAVPDFDPDHYKPPFRKGEKVVFKMETLGKDKAWNLEARGTLHAIEDDKPGK